MQLNLDKYTDQDLIYTYLQYYTQSSLIQDTVERHEGFPIEIITEINKTILLELSKILQKRGISYEKIQEMQQFSKIVLSNSFDDNDDFEERIVKTLGTVKENLQNIKKTKKKSIGNTDIN
jgi:hypothetical protein